MFFRAVLGAMFAAAAVGLISGCNKSNPQETFEVQSINASGIVASQSLAPADKAEQLAKAAEQLLTVQGFAYASDVADVALQQDPQNLRAKFIKAVLAPIMAQKGLLARIAPFAAQDPVMLDHYNQMISELQTKAPNSTLKSFLLDGPADIKTESDVQGYLDSIAEGFETLRQFAKASKDQTLTVMASDAFYNVMQKRWEDACTVYQPRPWDYKYNCPSPVNMMEVTMNRADFEGVQQLAAGYELFLSLYNSYDLSGGMRVALAHKGERTAPAPQKLIEELSKDPKFATLRAGNGFKKIKDMGADAISGMSWVMNNQNSLCPLGQTHPRNRLGSLFSHGLCVDPSEAPQLAKDLRTATGVLAGSVIQVVFNDSHGLPYVSLLKPAALMDAPIADLRSLTPLTFDHCNHLSGVNDGTVGGLFPNGDANKALQTNDSCSLN